MHCRRRATDQRRIEAQPDRSSSAAFTGVDTVPYLSVEPDLDIPKFVIVRINGSIVLVAVASPG
jgi:hypothetical protein